MEQNKAELIRKEVAHVGQYFRVDISALQSGRIGAASANAESLGMSLTNAESLDSLGEHNPSH